MSDAAKEQKDLLAQLEKADVKIAKDAAEKMKESIMNNGSGKKYLGLGVHEVFIQQVELFQANSGTMGIKFLVENEDGQGDAVMWVSEGALPYTIPNISSILVHNTAEENRDTVRNYMANVLNAKAAFDIAKEKLIQAQCWLSVKEAKDGSTYTDKNGVERPKLEKNLLSYKPRETTAQAVAKETGGEPVSVSGLPF